MKHIFLLACLIAAGCGNEPTLKQTDPAQARIDSLRAERDKWFYWHSQLFDTLHKIGNKRMCSGDFKYRQKDKDSLNKLFIHASNEFQRLDSTLRPFAYTPEEKAKREKSMTYNPCDND